MGLCSTCFYLYQSLLFCCRRTCGQNPVKNSMLQVHFRVALAAALRPFTQEAWLALYDLHKEKGEHVRLDWTGEEPPSTRARWTCSRCSTCFEVKLDHVVFIPILQGQAHQPPGTGESDQPPQANHTRRNAGTASLGTCGFVVLGAVSKGRSSSRKLPVLRMKLRK